MNVKRGLWRIWLVTTLLLISSVTALNFNRIKAAFDEQAKVDEILADGGKGLPVPCSEATRRTMGDASRTTMPIGSTQSYCWYPLSEVRQSWPEYSDQPDMEFMEDFYILAGDFLPRAYPWELLALAATAALGLPLVTLAFGWAVAGFAATPRKAD